ncbi:MAG: hypothetical protein K0Q47_1966 [Sedimentibacter sp.]|nr:hypothetical protein [Sedimentibacter sp.]
MVGILIALLAGLLMSVQGVFNTRVMDSSNMWATNSWVHLTAFIASITIWFFTGRENLLSVFNVSNKLYLFGGIIGAFITFTVIKSISSLGPAYATEKMCFEWSKLIGVALMIVGIVIFKK